MLQARQFRRAWNTVAAKIIMTETEILGIIARGEDSLHQFKRDVINAKSVGAELAAFANGHGGLLLIGVSDDGNVCALSTADVRRVNSLIANAASQNVRPAAIFTSENVQVAGGVVIAVSVPAGTDKPYFDSDGVIWQKAGADKRRVHSKEELRRLFQDSDLLQADAVPIPGATATDIALPELARLAQRLDEEPPQTAAEGWAQMARMSLVREDELTLAGLLLFAERPQSFKPQFALKAVYFRGNDQAGTEYLDSEDYEGRLPQLFQGAFAFLRRNLRKVQAGRSVNTQGVLEIPGAVFEELLCNALLHRDYLIDAPIRIFLFEDRVEIISPGLLPAGLTVESIRQGASIIRNPLLTSFATKGLLPYRGIGTGIVRVIHEFPDIRFSNDTEALLFRAIVQRPVPARQNPQIIGDTIGDNIGEKDGENATRLIADLSKIQLRIIKVIEGNPRVSAAAISSKVGISSRNIEVHLRKLRERGILVRDGPDRGGSWRVVRS